MSCLAPSINFGLCTMRTPWDRPIGTTESLRQSCGLLLASSKNNLHFLGSLVAPMRTWTIYAALGGVAALAPVQALCQIPGADFSQAEKQFAERCEGCHGQGGAGGDRAPALINSRSLRSRNESQIRYVIKNGTPGG